jgi:alpha-glucoside transport system substrate-binding protein
MAQIVANPRYVSGGGQGVLGTAFVDGIDLVFGKNAKAEMYMEGGFVGGIALGQVNKDLVPGQDIAFFPFPAIDEQFGSPVVGGGDLAVMLVDTPQVRELMRYLAGKEAAEIWSATGAIVSPNKLVDPKTYPNDLTRAEAAQIANATVFQFDGSDLLPANLAEHWGTALQDVVARPGEIERIARDFEAKARVEFNR